LFAIDAATAIAQQIGGKNYEIAIRLFYLSRLPVVINTFRFITALSSRKNRILKANGKFDI
jgi:hypothetical protein